MKLTPLPAFTDNYIWMLNDGLGAVVVDPGEAGPVEEALDALGLDLRAILVTHHHPDHVGGLEALRPRLAGPWAEVFGPAHEDIPGPYTPLEDGQRIDIFGLRLEVIDVPGHTAGHIAYWQLDGGDSPLLFCGDTLFSGGCGRLFEGTAEQMSRSLSRLAALPPDTRVCCTHEYTLSNLRFAAAVEPGNEALREYIQVCEELRSRNQPTLPSSIGIELAINPFLRCTQPEVVASARAQGAASDDPVAVFAALREWKNRFR